MTSLVRVSIVLMACNSCGGGGASEPLPDPTLAEVARSLRQANELLQSIASKLDRLTVRPEPVAQTSAPSASVGGEQVTALGEDLKLVREELAALPAKLARRPPAGVPRREPLPKQSRAVAEVVARFKADRDAEVARHFFWTPAEVYAAYGTPDGVEPTKLDQVVWSYYTTSMDAGVNFTFDGAQQVTTTVAW